jgi:RNA polymerase sigma factor (sigma-70 family)
MAAGGARAVPRTAPLWENRRRPAVTKHGLAVLSLWMEASSSMTLPARGGERPAPLPASFERLFRAEFARVVGIAHRVLGDQAEAEDVAQDVFLSFYRAHPAEAAYAASWLHAAAAHAALNALRGRQRRTRREATEAVAPDAVASDDPVAQVTAAETRDEVRAVLARLPERSAALLALRYAGLSYTEIATALDVRASSVGTLLRRAEDAFRRELT